MATRHRAPLYTREPSYLATRWRSCMDCDLEWEWNVAPIRCTSCKRVTSPGTLEAVYRRAIRDNGL